MKRLMNRMHGGQKGFTLIELLVVIAILGIIAAVVALNIAGFFGRGTLQAANTELHQAQTAIIAAMADAQGNQVAAGGTEWAGQAGYIMVTGPMGTIDASDYIFGPLRARYEVDADGAIVAALCEGEGEWGTSIAWDGTFLNWASNTTP